MWKYALVFSLCRIGLRTILIRWSSGCMWSVQFLCVLFSLQHNIMVQRRRDGIKPEMPTAAERLEMLSAVGGKPYWLSIVTKMLRTPGLHWEFAGALQWLWGTATLWRGKWNKCLLCSEKTLNLSYETVYWFIFDSAANESICEKDSYMCWVCHKKCSSQRESSNNNW